MLRIIGKLFGLVKDIYSDKQLLMSFSINDFKRKFAGSFFGMAWGFIQPLLTMIVYWVVFQFGFKSGDIGEIPFVLWFMCGIIPWLFFSEAFSMASNSFIEYSYLVKKVVFNINILPLVKVLSSAIVHLFFIALLTIICMFLGYYPSVYMLQVIYYLFCTIVLLFAITLITSSIMVFFRDINQIIGVLLLIGMWGTPIAWSPNTFPEKVQFFFKLNPIYYLVDGYRDAFLNHIWFWQKYNQTIYFWILTLGILILGVFIYNRLYPFFADTL